MYRHRVCLSVCSNRITMNYFPKSVVFITGTFIGNNCWDEWKIYFESKGYRCIAPAWPYKDATPEELRNRSGNDAIALNTITSLADHFAAIINSLPEKPVLIGHSLGGLVVQLLLQRNLGVAGVAIHSFPPQGVQRFGLSFLKVIWQTMMLFSSSRQTYMMPFLKWKYTIVNGMDCERQKQLFYKYAIPESKKVIRDVFRCRTKIDFKRSHTPLLFLAGAEDKMIRPSMNYRNYKKYDSEDSITGYKNFKGRNHLFFEHPQWKEEADYILSWLQRIQ
jgi:pimeloyl-ACP methyl ester carboxylesterase